MADVDATTVVDGIVERMQRLWGPLPTTPPAAPPAREPRVSDHTGYANGQYRELKADVDNLKGNFGDLRTEVHSLRTDLSGEIKDLGRTFSEAMAGLRADQVAAASTTPFSLGNMAIVGGVVLTIIGGFASLAKTNLDTNITFTNEKIATSNSVTEKNLASTNTAITSVANTIEKMTTIIVPRDEVDLRFNRDERDLLNKVNKDVLAETDKRYGVELGQIRADIDHLKTNAVMHREFAQGQAQDDERISTLGNRVANIAKDSGGASLSEQLKDLSQRFQDLQAKFLKP